MVQSVQALSTNRQANTDKVQAADINAIVQAIKDLDAALTNASLGQVADNSVTAAKIVDGSVGTAEIADGAVTDIKIPANKFLIGSSGGWGAIRTYLGNTFLKGGVYDSVAQTYTFSASTGSTGTAPTGAFGSMTYCIPASDLVLWPANGTAAAKNNALAANTARIIEEMVTRPGYHIELDPSAWWPATIKIDEFIGTYTRPDGTTGNFIEGATYSLGGKILQCRGTRSAGTDTDASQYVLSATTVAITRKSANAGKVVTPSNMRTVQLGGTPNLGSYFTGVCTGFDITADMNLYKAGGLLDLVSQNDYGWSERAGYGTHDTAGSGVYKAAFFPMAGLCVNVTGYSLTALNAAIGSGTVTTMERRTITGGTSGAVAVVQGGDFGANGQLLINGTTANFSSTEDILDLATGAKIATYASTTVCMIGKLNTVYDNTPQFRFVTKSRTFMGRVMIKPDNEIDDPIEGYNRPDAVFLTGCTGVDLEGIWILGGYSTGISLRSCWDVVGMVHVRDLPNHAYEGLSERAYGYAVRWLGHCQNFRVGLDVARVRHGTTSNGIRGTWNLNGRPGGNATGATSLCTNFWNHGPGMRYGTLYGRVENTWSACWDFHEGAEFVHLENPVAIQPIAGSGRATTSADGFSIRGFGITIQGAYTEGCRLGIYDLSGPLDNGTLVYANVYTGGVFKKCQAGGIMQSEDTFSEATAGYDIRGNYIECDPDARTPYQQFGILLRRGKAAVVDNKITSVGYAMIRLTSYVDSGGLGSSATGHVLIKNNEFDWTQSDPASRPISVETTYDDVTDWSNHIRANPTAGTQRPLQWISNSGGNSNIRWGDRSVSLLSSTKSTPSNTVAITGGTPVVTNIDVGGTSSAPAVHSTATAPTLTVQTNAGTGATAVFASGSNDICGEIRLTTGTASQAAGTQVRLNFGTAYSTDVFPGIAAGLNAHTRALGYSTHDSTGVTFQFGNAPAVSTEYRFSYNFGSQV